MTKHQTCVGCLCDFVGPDRNIGENYCNDCSQARGGEFVSRCVELEEEIERLQAIVDDLQRVVRWYFSLNPDSSDRTTLIGRNVWPMPDNIFETIVRECEAAEAAREK